MLTVYHAPGTRSGGVVWLLEELAVPYELEIVDVRAEGGAPESYRAIQPNKKVPAIVHDGVPVHERAAIFAYLADAFPQAGLAPPVGDPRRGPYLSWLVYNDAVLDPVMAAKMGGWQYEKMGVSFGAFDDMVRHLHETFADRDYVLGDQICAADILLLGGVNFALRMTKVLPSSPGLEAYVDRMMSRPAVARAVARGRAS